MLNKGFRLSRLTKKSKEENNKKWIIAKKTPRKEWNAACEKHPVLPRAREVSEPMHKFNSNLGRLKGFIWKKRAQISVDKEDIEDRRGRKLHQGGAFDIWLGREASSILPICSPVVLLSCIRLIVGFVGSTLLVFDHSYLFCAVASVYVFFNELSSILWYRRCFVLSFIHPPYSLRILCSYLVATPFISYWKRHCVTFRNYPCDCDISDPCPPLLPQSLA